MVFFFNGATAPLIAAYTAEQFPTDLRARGSGIGYSAGRVTNVIAPFTIAVALAAAGFLAVAWAGFAAWALIGLTVLFLGARTSGDNAATSE